MKKLAFLCILAILGVVLELFFLDSLGIIPWVILALIFTLVLVLSFARRSRFDPQIITVDILVMVIVIVGVSLEYLFGDIPLMRWTV